MENRLNGSDSDERFNAGQIVDEERVFGCCKKKRLWSAAVITFAILDTILFLWMFVEIGYTIAWSFRHTNEATEKIIVKLTVNSVLSYSPILILLVLKEYYMVIWFINGRKRRYFLPYYRISVTFNWSMFCACFTTFTSQIDQFSNPTFFLGQLELYSCLVSSAWCIKEFVFLELYVRHLDSLHFANNNLKRDENILKAYHNLQI